MDFPIHRKLISINRRNTRTSNNEFNLRHDWNSLLLTNVTPFTNWTEDYFPHSDVLVSYLRAVAAEQEGNILYDHKVASVEHAQDGFLVSVGRPDGETSAWQCRIVIAAVGLWRPNKPKDWIRGLQHTIGYEQLRPWPGGQAFDKLSVLILGNGNGAFETSDAVRNWASDIGILGRREARFAYQSHYVGDVRSHRGTSVDALQLKSLDDVFSISNYAGS